MTQVVFSCKIQVQLFQKFEDNPPKKLPLKCKAVHSTSRTGLHFEECIFLTTFCLFLQMFIHTSEELQAI